MRSFGCIVRLAGEVAHDQLLWLVELAVAAGVAAVAVEVDADVDVDAVSEAVVDPTLVVAVVVAVVAALWAAFTVMKPVMTSMLDMPAAPTTRRARRAGCGRRRRTGRAVRICSEPGCGYCWALSVLSLISSPDVRRSSLDDLVNAMVRYEGKSPM
jgi:hypothetical protein